MTRNFIIQNYYFLEEQTGFKFEQFLLFHQIFPILSVVLAVILFYLFIYLFIYYTFFFAFEQFGHCHIYPN